METSITSKMISQQTIYGDPENIEIANYMEPKLPQHKEQMEITHTRKNLIQAWKVTLNTFHLRTWLLPNPLSKVGKR